MDTEGPVCFTDVPGVRVGHWTDVSARTGCTVVLFDDEGATVGVDVRGAAPGTRETDLLRPECTVGRAHAVLLTGGSAFGLAAADGVMEALEAAGVGVDVGVARVPIVPSAVLFDLAVGQPSVRPDRASGVLAVADARAGDALLHGRIGAGTGGTVGKWRGTQYAVPGGLGSAALDLPSGGRVAALVAVNAVGDIYEADGALIAGTLAPSAGAEPPIPGANTTLGVVVTDVALTKAGATRLATVAHDGLARAINPVHTAYDGDTIFAASTGTAVQDELTLHHAAALVMAEAVRDAVRPR